MDWSFLKFNVKVIYLIENITVAILLQITEQLMEPVFICLCNEYRIHFVTTYFTVPAAALTALALSHQEGRVFIGFPKYSGEKCRSYLKGIFQCLLSSLKVFYPAMCWIVILLIDGKYAACGVYDKCNCTMCTVALKDPELLKDMMKSKLWGFSIIAGFVLLYFIFLLWNCRQSAAYRYERMYLSQLEEDREEFAKEYMKMCSKKRREQCEKSLSRKTEVNPEAEDTTPPGAGSTTPPGAESTTPPRAESTTPPGAESTTPPGAGSTTPPRAESTTPPRAESTTPPGAESTTPPGAAGGVDPYLDKSLKASSEGVDDLTKHENVKLWAAVENLGEVDPLDKSPKPPSLSTDHGGVPVLQAAAPTVAQSAQSSATSSNLPKQSKTASGDTIGINEEDTETIVNKIKKFFEYTTQTKCKLCSICFTDSADNSPAPSVNKGSASPEISSTAVQSNESPTPSGAARGADPEHRLDTETQDFQMEDVNQLLVGKSCSNQQSMV